jgi:hypothetical protein
MFLSEINLHPDVFHFHISLLNYLSRIPISKETAITKILDVSQSMLECWDVHDFPFYPDLGSLFVIYQNLAFADNQRLYDRAIACIEALTSKLTLSDRLQFGPQIFEIFKNSASDLSSIGVARTLHVLSLCAGSIPFDQLLVASAIPWTLGAAASFARSEAGPALEFVRSLSNVYQQVLGLFFRHPAFLNRVVMETATMRRGALRMI